MSPKLSENPLKRGACRLYGHSPYSIAVLHGGPGAPGEMAPLAEEISSYCSDSGVLEPLQTEDTIAGQLHELKSVLDKHAAKPIMLIGWSWGAWLAFIFAAQYPLYVSKLILIGSGPFEEKYAASIMKTRLCRLSQADKTKLDSLIADLGAGKSGNKKMLMNQFGEIISKADSYQPLPLKECIIGLQPEIYRKVWEEASRLRKTGRLLSYGRKIICPVLAIHGDYDPHPAEGVRLPLSKTLRDFRFVLLEKCGHTPWQERLAKKRFYAILRSELEI